MKTNRIIQRAALLSMMLGMAAVNAQAAPFIWDADPLTPGLQNGSGTWDATAENWQDASANNTAWGNSGADQAFFGGGADATGTITVVGTMKGNNLTINSGDYVFTGGDLAFEANDANTSILNLNASGGTTTFNNQLSIRRILFSQAGQTLILNGNRNLGFLYSWGSVNASVTGADAATAKVSTVRMTGGYYNTSNATLNIGDTVNETGGLVIQTSATHNIARGNNYVGSGGEGLVTVDGGWLRVAPDGNNQFLGIGEWQSYSVGKVIVNSGSLTVANANGRIYIARMGKGELSVRGGVVDSGDVYNLQVTQGTANGTLSVSGGSLYARGIQFGEAGSTTGSATLTQTGGAIYLGTEGLRLGDTVTDLTPVITLSGGTLGVTASATGWTTALNITLSDADGGVKFDATAGKTITLDGVLSGNGGLTVGGGTLLLSGANTYAGDTIVSAGTLELGNVSALGGVADLLINSGALVNLNYAGTAVIDSLLLDNVTISNLVIGQGYTATELNTALSANIFTGGGLLSVSTIPEPSTWTLLLTGAALLAVRRRKR